MKDLISLSDGKTSLIEIAEICHVPIWHLYVLVEKLQKKKILKLNHDPI